MIVCVYTCHVVLYYIIISFVKQKIHFCHCHCQIENQLCGVYGTFIINCFNHMICIDIILSYRFKGGVFYYDTLRERQSEGVTLIKNVEKSLLCL